MKTIPFEEERKAAFAKLAEFKARANTPAEKAAYEERLKNLRDYYNTIDTAAEEAYVKGLVEGFVEGFSESFAESFTEPFAEGLAEARAEAIYNFKSQVIANMLTMGANVSVISDCVDMTEEEVRKIIQTLS